MLAFRKEAPREACIFSSFLLASVSGALFTDAVVEQQPFTYTEVSLRCVFSAVGSQMLMLYGLQCSASHHLW